MVESTQLSTQENGEKEMALSRTAGEKKLCLIACLLPLQMSQTPAFSPMSKLGTGVVSYNFDKTTVCSHLCLQRSLQFKVMLNSFL